MSVSKKEGIIEKIKSKYILNAIFDYISNDNYKLKLFIYSKSLQQKYDFKIEYKYAFLKEYLRVEDFILLDLIDKKLDTNYFYKILNDILDFIHLTNEESKEISKVIYKNYIKEQKKMNKVSRYTDNLSTIDIYSPFIEYAISNDFHFINIPLDDIQKYNLINDYISFFKKQNEKDKKYKVLISLKNAKQINILKDLNINFYNINQFIFVFMNNPFYFNGCERKDPILNSIYSLVNMPNILEVLDLYFDRHYSITDIYFPKWFNSLINLKELKISGMDFNSKLIISLPKLEIIKLNCCENIDFLHEIVDKNLKYLQLVNTGLKSLKKHIFENLEELEISQTSLYIIDIDFSFLKKLKKYGVNNLTLMEKIYLFPLLEEVSFMPNKKYAFESIDKGILNLILSNKTIQKINIELPNISNEDLIDSSTNDNINDISLIIGDKSNENIQLFLERFSNIKKLKINFEKDCYPASFSIIENKNIIIEELELSNPNISISFSFSYLRSLTLDFSNYKYKYKYFSLFNSNCKTNFSNLENLNISISEKPIKLSLLKNFANNTKYFKNVKKIKFKFNVKELEDIEQITYFYFIEKLLSLNLTQLYISFDINKWNEFYKIHFKFYTKSELKTIFKKNIKEDSNYIYKIQRIKTDKKCLIF